MQRRLASVLLLAACFDLGCGSTASGRAAATPAPAPTPTAAPPWTGALPRPEVLELATRAQRCAAARGQLAGSILAVIDYSLPSVERRLWVLDLDSRGVLFHELVAHGRGSGENFARLFSNEEGSKMSSLGLFRTADAYEGKHGISLRLIGLEAGVNDRAEERYIVMHGADYVSEEHARRWGRLGRSWGCPALGRAVAPQVIDRLQGGAALFAYYPDTDWLATSQFLHCDAAPR